jgi:hypothetical protein
VPAPPLQACAKSLDLKELVRPCSQIDWPPISQKLYEYDDADKRIALEAYDPNRIKKNSSSAPVDIGHI